MATATMATAAGAAALLYYTLKWKLQSGRLRESGEGEEGEEGEDVSRPVLPARNLASRMPAQAPMTWFETISTLSEILRFTYSETLGKWPIADLAFGITFLLRRQGYLPVASIFAGEECIQLKGAEIVVELKYLLNLLNLCWHFSKKQFPLFLETTGYSQEDVILLKPKAGILKPAFIVLIDRNTKRILLLVRGTHSIRDTLTAVNGAIVPFHHTLVNGGGISDLVLGFAHCGMVAAARWIAKLVTPYLLEALQRYSDYSVQIVGHSLGGGTAALLTYILREKQEFATTTCVTFAPAACMTLELAESGMHFVTSIINGADLVPSFSAASLDDLRSEVTASPWLNDFRNQIEQTRIVSTVYRSASTLGSKLPSIASARSRLVDAGAILRPISSGTQPRQNEEAEVEKEIIEENGAAAFKATPVVCEDEETSEIIPTVQKEVRRFYPPGRIMHIVTSLVEMSNQEDASTSPSDEIVQLENKIAIFLTPRLLYGKLRLSQAMIHDHYMPIYRGNMEQLISTLEKETSEDGCSEEGIL